MVDPSNNKDLSKMQTEEYQEIEKEEKDAPDEFLQLNIDEVLREFQQDTVKIVSVANKIRKGNFKPVLKAIMEKKLPPNLMVDLYSKIYLIHYAAFFNSTNVLQYLMSFPETNINILDSKLQTPLQVASTSGRLEAILLLAQNEKCDTENKDSLNCTALLNCVKSTCIQGFLFLIIMKNSNHLIQDQNGCGILHWAAFTNSIELILLSLSLEGISLDIIDLDGLTPLFRSIQNSQFSAFKLLLKLDSNVNHLMKDGKDLKSYIKESCRHSENFEFQLAKEIYSRNIKQNNILSLFRNLDKIKNLELLFKELFKAKLKFIFILYLVVLILSHFFLSAELFRNSFLFLFIFLIITFLILVSYFKLKLSDPLYILPLNEPYPNKVLRTYSLEGNLNKNLSKRMCFFCQNERNPEDYHCMKCGKCIIERHFHSFSLDKCIGKSNILIYNIFILLRTILFTLSFVQYIYYSNEYEKGNFLTNWIIFFLSNLTNPLFIFSFVIIICDILLCMNDLLLILYSSSNKITIKQLFNIEHRKESLKFNYEKRRFEIENFTILQKLNNIFDFYSKVIVGYSKRKISFEMEERIDQKN